MPDEPYDVIRYQRRWNILRTEQSVWRQHWRDLAQFIAPRRGRYLTLENDNLQYNGAKKNQSIINGAASKAVRTLGAGLQGGLTSPARPWFELGLADNDLARYTPVKLWLEQARDILLAIFAGSNFYASNHTSYEEVGIFGTSCMLIDEDFDTIIHCRPFTIGEYCLDIDAQGRPNGLYRAFNMNAAQIKEKFGPTLPLVVQQAIDNKQFDLRWEVLHVIEPAAMQDETKKDYRGMPYHSCYFLRGLGPDGVLRRGGYKSIPFIAPRWVTAGSDTYGSSPGMDALGDVRQLQKMEDKKLRALDKWVDPPMVGPSSMKGSTPSLVPGGMSYIDVTSGGQGFGPAMSIVPNLQQMAFEIDRTEKRIEETFYNPLFLAISNQTKEMTATEIAQRYEEKLMMLGPVIERLQSESLSIVIDRTFSIASDFGLIPPPPQELPAGTSLHVNYISILAQAQKLVGTGGLERFTQFVGAMAPLSPDVIDRVDFDQVVIAYGDMTGVPPKVVRDDETTTQIRTARQKQQQAAQLAASAEPLANAAKSASQAELGKDRNLLQTVTGN